MDASPTTTVSGIKRQAGNLRRVSKLRVAPSVVEVERPQGVPSVADMASASNTSGLHNMSIDQNFPSIKPLRPLQRIKGTINDYAKQCAEIDWFDNQKPGTLGALGKRWLGHRDEVIGQYNLDVQIA